nr:hypothetical protein [Streptomyces sp. alain-838]
MQSARNDPQPAPAPKDSCIIPRDPDFELYDNVGRDADQIQAARYNLATRGDLKRWAQRDAQPFRAAYPLPDQPWPAPDLTPYLDALAAARTPAEIDAVTDHVLDAAEPALRALSDYLVAAARWKQENRDAAKGSPSHLLMTAASRALSALALADEAGLNRLRAAYDPAPPPQRRPTPRVELPRACRPLLPPQAPGLAVSSSPSVVPVCALTHCTPDHPDATAVAALPAGRKEHTL